MIAEPPTVGFGAIQPHNGESPASSAKTHGFWSLFVNPLVLSMLIRNLSSNSSLSLLYRKKYHSCLYDCN